MSPESHAEGEPFYIEESCEADRDQRWLWMFSAAQAAASRHKCAYFRVSFDPKTSTCLLEGWLTRPEDCGEPRWRK